MIICVPTEITTDSTHKKGVSSHPSPKKLPTSISLQVNSVIFRRLKKQAATT